MTPTAPQPDWVDGVLATLPALLTVAECCGVLRCSKRSFYRLATSGRIRTLRAADTGSARLLTPRDALRDYLRTLAS